MNKTSLLDRPLSPEGLSDLDCLFDPSSTTMESRYTLSGFEYARRREFGFSHGKIVLEGPQEFLDWFTPICRDLCRVLDLPPNWDSYGAPTIEAESASIALFILKEISSPLVPRPAIVPTVHGGIQLEWHANDMELEVEISPDGRVHIFYEDRAGLVIDNEDSLWVQTRVLKGLMDRLASHK